MINLTILLAIFSFPLFAANHVAFLGGGGEPQGSKTIFDQDVKRFGNFVERMPGANVTVSFNGGHSGTEGKLAENFPASPNTPFTATNFEALVSRYESDIQAGRINSADQLMLYIDTHGAEQSPGGQTTHNIATTGGSIANFDNLAGARSVSLDRLRNLTTLAEARGIRLAIIDVSCHSGASQSLANSKTCVISATGPRHYGFAGSGTFSSNFINRMRPGRNLNDIFHSVRDDSADTDFPMISSPAGKDVQDQIYPLLTRFLYDYERNSPSKLRGDIINSISTNSCEQENESLATLINLLNNVENVTNENFRRLREAVSEYQVLRTTMQNQLRGMITNPVLTESRQFCHGGRCFTYSGKEVIAMDIPAAVAVANQAGVNTPSQAAFYQSWANTLNQLAPWKAQLLANPAVANFPNYFHNYPDLERQSERLARRISKEERRLYREMHEQASASDQRPNPCKDFRL
ncbi:MAG: hypothetical protein V4598_01325 [Bdellovibrionota bacterium]